MEDDNSSEGTPSPENSPIASSFWGAMGDLMKKMLGPAADEIGEDLALKYRSWEWRRKNLETIALKVALETERRELDPNDQTAMPEGDAFRALEACSLEDNETVQSLWAGLLVSAMNPRSEINAEKAFVEILKSINEVDAGLLLLLNEAMKPIDIQPFDRLNMTPDEQREYMVDLRNAEQRAKANLETIIEQLWRRHSHNARAISIQNLMRLRCIGYRTEKSLDSNNTFRRPIGVSSQEIPANAEAVAKALDYVEELARAATGTVQPRFKHRVPAQVPELIYDFTPLGSALMEACVEDIGLQIVH